MILLIIILTGLGFAAGWYANDRKKELKSWVGGILRKANTKVKDL